MPRYFPDIPTFTNRAASAEIIPVYRQLLADWLTPVSAFAALARDATHAFLLESVVGGEKIARYSFIATNPSAVYSCGKGSAFVTHGPAGVAREFHSSDPLSDLADLLPPTLLRYYHDPSLPTFTGGLVGYAGYDTIRYYEAEKLTAPPADDRNLPDVLFGLYGELVVFDHVDKTIKVVANARVEAGKQKADIDAAYADASARVDAIVQRLNAPVPRRGGEIDPSVPVSLDFAGNMTRAQYEQRTESMS